MRNVYTRINRPLGVNPIKVGYLTNSDGGNTSPGIGAQFIPVNGGDTYLLQDFKVAGATASKFMVPNVEYLQELDPKTVGVVHRYTYVSEAYLKDEYEEEWESHTGLIGWWEKGHIGEEGYRKDTQPFSVGTAFLGALNGKSLKFTSSGAVPQETKTICDNGNTSPYFQNFLPTTFKLKYLVVEGATASKFMVPNVEYLQELDPKTVGVVHRYTYVSEAYLKDEYEDEWAEHIGLIGWWEKGHIGDEDYRMDDIDVKPGDAWLGALNGKNLKFNFPSATDPISE